MEKTFLIKHPVKNDIRTYDNIRKIATSQGDDCTTGFFLIILILKIIIK